MKVVGFTIIRNNILYDFGVLEAIYSIMPLCDLIVVAVGKSEDSTLEQIKNLDSDKIKIIETVWDDSLRSGGRVLALETDKAYQPIPDDADRCFYIQDDEVLHEKYLDTVRTEMIKHQHNPLVDGLLFEYTHFYGSYDYVGNSWQWYNHEIRIIRKNKNYFSYRDAQGFRKKPNNKLKVKKIDAKIFHYGWVREPQSMQRKLKKFHSLYHNDNWTNKHFEDSTDFDYSNIDSLENFKGTHPKVMQERILRMNWKFKHDISKNKFSFRERWKRRISRWVGYKVGEYKNYILLE